MAQGNRQFASLAQRAIAVIIDGIIIVLASMIVFAIMAGTMSRGNFAVASVIPFGFTFIVFVVYILLEGLYGVTPGKKVIGIKIVGEDGRVPGIVPAIIRNVLRIIDTLPTLYIIGALLVYTNEDNQRLGDMLANTYVVQA